MTVSLSRDLNDVLIFLQVATSGSFTAAGRDLGMPTSTVSRRVARLEEQLGVLLLQRTTRKLSLTEAGRLYHERGSALFSGLEETENILADARENPRGRVRATAPLEHSISLRLVMPFLDRHPDVRLDLELTNRTVNIIEEGYDVAICAGPISNLSVVAHHLMDSPFHIVASSDYFDRRGEPSTVAELEEHDCVVVGPASASATWTLIQDGTPVRVDVSGRVAVNDLAAARDLALGGMGLALLPALTCARDIRAGTLRVVLERVAPAPVPVWVTHLGSRHLAPAVRAFVQHVREHFVSVSGAD